jgi:superfamily II DNA helicase RecQ
MFSQLLRSPEFAKYLLSIIVDEAHCISEWGETFRKDYAELGRLRSYVPTHIPFLVTSATMPPAILLDVQHKLEFETSKTFIINLGNDRPNITPIVARMSGAASNLTALDFVLDEPRSDNPLKRTIIFFNSRELAYKGCRHLRKLISPGMARKINFIHALRANGAKRKVMRNFRSGEVDILCATEAAGMVGNLLVVFSVPDPLPGYGYPRRSPCDRLHGPVVTFSMDTARWTSGARQGSR